MSGHYSFEYTAYMNNLFMNGSLIYSKFVHVLFFTPPKNSYKVPLISPQLKSHKKIIICLIILTL